MRGKCQTCGCECDLTKHHLVPRVKCHNKYKAVEHEESNFIWICRSCHDQIHALYDENTLRDRYSTLELLLADERFGKFVAWKKKHADFKGHAKRSNDRR